MRQDHEKTDRLLSSVYFLALIWCKTWMVQNLCLLSARHIRIASFEAAVPKPARLDLAALKQARDGPRPTLNVDLDLSLDLSLHPHLNKQKS